MHMNGFQAIILGLVQGATEFLPVSSSGHLVLVPWLLGWPDPGLSFDAVLHLGTLVAVLAALRHDLLDLLHAALASVRHRDIGRPEARLLWWLALATLPAASVGLLFEEQFETLFHSPNFVAVFLIVTGCWLALTERLGRKTRNTGDLGWWEALAIGVAQGCAIAPGISRSGSTIGAGLLVGLRREAATRFSFLLATPIILGAGAIQMNRLLEALDPGLGALEVLLGFGAAVLSGYASIQLLLRIVRQRGLLPFSLYCWAAGVFALGVYYLR
jgi:undecaprenyl-diphosphatase